MKLVWYYVRDLDNRTGSIWFCKDGSRLWHYYKCPHSNDMGFTTFCGTRKELKQFLER